MERQLDYFVWSTIILSIWGALGPLVGIFIGHHITKAWQKKQWIFENKKVEYREVLHVLSSAIQPLIQQHKPGLITDAETLTACVTAENAAYEVLGNRIFVAADLDTINAYDRWATLVAKFQRNGDDKTFAKEFQALSADIRRVALKSMES